MPENPRQLDRSDIHFEICKIVSPENNLTMYVAVCNAASNLLIIELFVSFGGVDMLFVLITAQVSRGVGTLMRCLRVADGSFGSAGWTQPKAEKQNIP